MIGYPSGKMELSCPLGTTRCIPQEKFPQSQIINPLLTKLVRSNKKELGQYPAILTEQAWSITHISKLTTPDWKALSLHEEPSTSGGSFSCHKTLKKNQSAYKYFDMSKENKTKKNTFTLPLYFFSDQRRQASADTSLRYCRESVRIWNVCLLKLKCRGVSWGENLSILQFVSTENPALTNIYQVFFFQVFLFGVKKLRPRSNVEHHSRRTKLNNLSSW